MNPISGALYHDIYKGSALTWVANILDKLVSDVVLRASDGMGRLSEYSCDRLKSLAHACVTAKRKARAIHENRDASDETLANSMKPILELDARSMDTWLACTRGDQSAAIERIRVVAMLLVNKCNAYIPLVASIAILSIFKCKDENELSAFHSWTSGGIFALEKATVFG